MPRMDDWEQIGNEFLKPFPNSEISFLPKAGRQLAHIDARAVMRRLDQTVGQEGWLWDYDVIPSENGACVKGKLTVLGITKCDVGEESGSEEPMKRAVSDALKRSAIHFGIGRFLYELGTINSPQLPPERLADAAEAAGWVGDRAALIAELRADAQPTRGPSSSPAPAGRGSEDRPPQDYDRPTAQTAPAAAAQETGEASSMICVQDGCGKPLTKGQHDVSMRAFGRAMCPFHQRTAARS